MQRRDPAPLTGALFVVLVLVAFIALGGETPEGDASAREVVSFYTDNDTKEIIASVVLALSTVPLVYFSSLLRERFRAAMPGSALPGFVLGAGVVAAGGFLAAAGIHFALADYAEDIQPAAAQAINAIDGDFFLPFSVGVVTLVLASSLAARRTGLLPTWLAWVGILLFVVAFTPAGFIAFGLSGIWIIVTSIMLYLRAEAAAPATGPATPD